MAPRCGVSREPEEDFYRNSMTFSRSSVYTFGSDPVVLNHKWQSATLNVLGEKTKALSKVETISCEYTFDEYV